MEKFKRFADSAIAKVRNAKFAVGALTASAAAPIVAVVASAEGETTSSGTTLADYTDQITNQFTSTANQIIPIIVSVLGAALGVFAIFMGIRYAKRMFSTVSK